MKPEHFADAAMVVAHPDDEILWFSSVIDHVAAIHICYLDVPGQPTWTAGRHAAKANFPLRNAHFVGLTESVAFQCANWAEPQPNPYGMALNAKHRALPGFDEQRYIDNYDRLVSYLRDVLTPGQIVLTHNPWGEYGHEEHLQVHRAVTALADELHLEVWHSSYVSDRSANLMSQTLAGAAFEHITLPTNLDTAGSLERLYRDTDCWTWPFDDYRWFAQEHLIRRCEDKEIHGSTMPLNFINVDRAELSRRFNQPKIGLRAQLMQRLLNRPAV